MLADAGMKAPESGRKHMDSFEIAKIAGGFLMALLLIFGVKTAIDMSRASHGGDHGDKVVGYALPMPEAEASQDGKEAHEAAPKAESKTAPAADKADADMTKSTDEPAKTESAAKPDMSEKSDTAQASTNAPPAEEKKTETAIAATTLPVTTGGNAKKGKKLFKKCQACHSDKEGGPQKVGPALWGIVGRTKGGVDGFNYSKAMKEKGGSWTAADLTQFLRSPKKYLPGTKMVFTGFKKDTDLENIISYLETLK